MKKEQQKYLINVNIKLSAYILDQVSIYSKKTLDNVEIIFNDRKMYEPYSLRARMLD